MSSDSESSGRGVTVTIKYGKDYQEPWAVFRGSPSQVREDILAYFGMSPESVDGLTLSEVVVNATALAHAKGAIASKLGGTVMTPAQQAPKQSLASLPGAGDPWAEAANGSTETSPAEPAVNPLFAEIEAAGDVKALQRMWAENKAAFDDDSKLMDAWKARGKALTAAAK